MMMMILFHHDSFFCCCCCCCSMYKAKKLFATIFNAFFFCNPKKTTHLLKCTFKKHLVCFLQINESSQFTNLVEINDMRRRWAFCCCCCCRFHVIFQCAARILRAPHYMYSLKRFSRSPNSLTLKCSNRSINRLIWPKSSGPQGTSS